MYQMSSKVCSYDISKIQFSFFFEHDGTCTETVREYHFNIFLKSFLNFRFFKQRKSYLPISQYDATLYGAYDTQKLKVETFI